MLKIPPRIVEAKSILVFCVAADRAIYSASVVESATVACFLLFHEIAHSEENIAGCGFPLVRSSDSVNSCMWFSPLVHQLGGLLVIRFGNKELLAP